jgi:hypothetical protein
MMRSFSVLPVALLAVGAISPASALWFWMLAVLTANLSYAAKRRDSARSISIAAAISAPLLWVATLGTLAAISALLVALALVAISAGAMRFTATRNCTTQVLR